MLPYFATADCRLPTADCRLPTADCRLPTADCRLPTGAFPSDLILDPDCLWLVEKSPCMPSDKRRPGTFITPQQRGRWLQGCAGTG
ncbi:hypothetical protein EHZ50_14970 [Aeromonas caviae]|nr:hypothetical protein EHZ50_14970 [Aeromonas caviae]